MSPGIGRESPGLSPELPFPLVLESTLSASERNWAYGNHHDILLVKKQKPRHCLPSPLQGDLKCTPGTIISCICFPLWDSMCLGTITDSNEHPGAIFSPSQSPV